jgi:acylphosphatase
MNKMVRAHVVITGRVQGVFFRMETKHQAQAQGVSGWVRNKSDGSVEAVFEGEMETVESLINWCKTGPVQADVTHVDVTWEDYKKQFSCFSIVH